MYPKYNIYTINIQRDKQTGIPSHNSAHSATPGNTY